MGFFDRIFVSKNAKGGFDIKKDGPSMGEMMSRAQETPPLSQAERDGVKLIGAAEVMRQQEAIRTRLEEARAFAKGRMDAANEAEAEIWSQLSGLFDRLADVKNSLQRQQRLLEETDALKKRNLGKGPEAEAVKFQAIEEFEHHLKT